MKLISALIVFLLVASSAFAIPPAPAAGRFDTCGIPEFTNSGTLAFFVWSKAMFPIKWEFPLLNKINGQVSRIATNINMQLIEREGRPVYLRGFLVDLGNGRRGYVPEMIDEIPTRGCR